VTTPQRESSFSTRRVVVSDTASRESRHGESRFSTRCDGGGEPPVTDSRATADTASRDIEHGESRFSTRCNAVSGTLAERQAALVAALVTGAPDPAGFDPARLSAARRALLRKRAGEAAKHWPVLAASLGSRWSTVFAVHQLGREPVGGLRDGWHLARALRPDLSAGAAAELREREALWRYDGVRPPRPRRLAHLLRAAHRWVGVG
jgi:hypothetical protein